MEFIIGALILILDIIAIVDVIGSNKDTAMKLVWILIILLLPVIGMIVYFVFGR